MAQTKTYSLRELRAMKDRGEVHLPGPDAPEIDMPEGFWDNARRVDPRPFGLLRRLADKLKGGHRAAD